MYVFNGITNPTIITIPIFVSICLYTEYFPSYFCDISYLYDFGHFLVGSKIIYLANEFRYELVFTGFFCVALYSTITSCAIEF